MYTTLTQIWTQLEQNEWKKNAMLFRILFILLITT